jgi:hypothetical protein
VTPALKLNVPRLFIPVAADEAVVAPVKAQVNAVTPQLSPVVGFEVATLAVHDIVPVLVEIFAGQVTVGAILSTTVIV